MLFLESEHLIIQIEISAFVSLEGLFKLVVSVGCRHIDLLLLLSVSLSLSL